MNGTGEKRYHASFEKISKKLRLLQPCCICGEKDFKKLEVHHIDENKKNGSFDNLVVLCQSCHSSLHKGKIKLPEKRKVLKSNKFKIIDKIKGSWINKKSRLKLIILPSDISMKYRKRYVKGWIIPGACNLYIGLLVDNILCGVLGFQNPDLGDYDLMLKADTTNSKYKYSIDLLLYAMRSNEAKKILERKFNREIRTFYSMCFTSKSDISRYRKHGKKTKKKEVKGGYNIAYTFKAGSICSLKSAKMEFLQKHKDL